MFDQKSWTCPFKFTSNHLIYSLVSYQRKFEFRRAFQYVVKHKFNQDIHIFSSFNIVKLLILNVVPKFIEYTKKDKLRIINEKFEHKWAIIYLYLVTLFSLPNIHIDRREDLKTLSMLVILHGFWRRVSRIKCCYSFRRQVCQVLQALQSLLRTERSPDT